MKWIFSYNIRYFDLHAAIHELESIDWDIQNYRVEEEDEIYLYSGTPEQTIYYKCKVVKTNKPETTIDDYKYGGHHAGLKGRFCEIVLEKEFTDPGITYQILLEKGVKRGTITKRRIKEPKLLAYIEEYESDPSNLLFDS